MSAFICSDKHISALVNWAARNKCDYWPEGAVRRSNVECHEKEVFKMLLAENYASVNYRYNEEDEPEGTYDPKALVTDPVHIIKMCHCLDYQSCEHPGWADSRAKALLDQIESAAIRALPGYDNAPWELT